MTVTPLEPSAAQTPPQALAAPIAGAPRSDGRCLMSCPECGSRPHDSDAFCTECGSDLQTMPEPRAPLSVGNWNSASGQVNRTRTKPSLVLLPPTTPGSAPVRLQPEAPGTHPALVHEMANAERTAWVESVWCSPAGTHRGRWRPAQAACSPRPDAGATPSTPPCSDDLSRDANSSQAPVTAPLSDWP